MTDNPSGRLEEDDGLEYIARPALDFTVEILSTLPEEARVTLIEQLALTLDTVTRLRVGCRVIAPLTTPNRQ